MPAPGCRNDLFQIAVRGLPAKNVVCLARIANQGSWISGSAGTVEDGDLQAGYGFYGVDDIEHRKSEPKAQVKDL